MCGRFASFGSEPEVVGAFDVDEVLGYLGPSWNVAPTQSVSLVAETVVDGAVVRQLRTARWGLVASWAKSVAGPPLVNARAETLTVKASFRAAARRRRAIVPANGYYEWLDKTPYYLAPADGGLLGFAGVYEWWHAPDDSWLCSVAVVTRPASDALGHVHDRMPVVVPPDLRDAWLDPALTGAADVDALLAAIPVPELVPRQVGPAVGSVRNNGPELIAELTRW